MGNLRNVQKAFEHIGVPARISPRADELANADGLILPGVGAFGDAMGNLNRAGLVQVIRDSVDAGQPLLGICLGLQLLFDESTEMGCHRGLGILPGRVVRFGTELKVPHIGWNQLQISKQEAGQVLPDSGTQTSLLDGIPDGSHAYFVHSYYAVPKDPRCVLATTDYGIDFASIVGQDNVFGAQPHPEKSQEVGLQLLRNFASIVSQARKGTGTNGGSEPKGDPGDSFPGHRSE
jgi:glutamine amidotransferase